MPDAAFEAELAELKAAYAVRLKEIGADAVAALSQGAAGRKRALKLFHRMRGTAGSYGFDAAARAAGAVEDALEARDEAAIERAAAAFAAAIKTL